MKYEITSSLFQHDREKKINWNFLSQYSDYSTHDLVLPGDSNYFPT